VERALSKKAGIAYKTVPFWGDRNRLPVDPDDPEVQYTFSNGQCHSLALALHRLTGWPLRVLCRRYGSEPSDDLLAARSGIHVVVEDPTGRFVDIDGPWNPKAPANWAWEHTIPVPVSSRAVRRLGWDRIDSRAALPFARAVLQNMESW
jgi:hypothetical protein